MKLSNSELVQSGQKFDGRRLVTQILAASEVDDGLERKLNIFKGLSAFLVKNK